VTGVPAQIVVGVDGLMLTAGATTGLETTVFVLAVEVPHTLVAVTLIVPPMAVGVAAILVAVEVPPQPVGNDQV
jgi:hypothetical protein